MRDRSMVAARIVAPGRVSVDRVPSPAPGPREIVVRVAGTGVCASNLGPWRGLPWLTYPLGPGEGGHEAWGNVEALGDGVTGFSLGDRVTGLSSRAYAQLDVMRADAVVKIPDALSEAELPGEPLACAVNVFERARIEAGHTVVVVGVGFIGSIVTRLASRRGARVIAVSRRPAMLELARHMGAADVVEMDGHARILARVRQLTDGAFADRVVECVGHQWPLDLASELTRERGTLVIAGYHQDGPRTVNMQLWNWRGLDVVNAHERDPRVYVRGMLSGLEHVLAGEIPLAPLLTHHYPLSRLAEALQATAEKPEGFVKAVVTP